MTYSKQRGSILLISLIFMLVLAWDVYTLQGFLITQERTLEGLPRRDALKLATVQALNEIEKNIQFNIPPCLIEQENFSALFSKADKKVLVKTCDISLDSRIEGHYWVESFSTAKQTIFLVHLQTQTLDKLFLQAIESVIILKNKKTTGNNLL